MYVCMYKQDLALNNQNFSHSPMLPASEKKSGFKSLALGYPYTFNLD